VETTATIQLAQKAGQTDERVTPGTTDNATKTTNAWPTSASRTAPGQPRNGGGDQEWTEQPADESEHQRGEHERPDPVDRQPHEEPVGHRQAGDAGDQAGHTSDQVADGRTRKEPDQRCGTACNIRHRPALLRRPCGRSRLSRHHMRGIARQG
jgi:hypothetical protein